MMRAFLKLFFTTFEFWNVNIHMTRAIGQSHDMQKKERHTDRQTERKKEIREEKRREEKRREEKRREEVEIFCNIFGKRQQVRLQY